MFLGAIDSTIVSVSLLSMSRDLLGVELMGWVVSGYLVAATVATPIYGKLSDLYGRLPLLSVAIVITMAASVLCAFAQTMPQLVAFRILQGLGGGGLVSIVQATVGDVARGPERGRYQGYFSGVFAVAALIGPILGGYLTHYLSWRAIFVLNLPLALAALLVARRSLARLPVAHRRHAIDWLGALLLTAGLSMLLTGLTRIGQGYAWTAPSTLALFGAAAVTLLACTWQEFRASEPIIPPAIFANRVVTLNSLALAFSFFVLIGCSVMLPLSMQLVGGASADGVAMRMIPMTLATPSGSFIAGRAMVAGVRFRPLMIIGAAIDIPALLAIALLPSDAHAALAAAMVMLGIGLGMLMPAALVGMQMAVPPHQIGVATATQAFFRNFGGAVGIAILTSILFSASRPDAAVSGAAALPPALALSAAAGSDAGAALAPAFRSAFLACVISAVGALACSLLVRDRSGARTAA